MPLLGFEPQTPEALTLPTNLPYLAVNPVSSTQPMRAFIIYEREQAVWQGLMVGTLGCHSGPRGSRFRTPTRPISKFLFSLFSWCLQDFISSAEQKAELIYSPNNEVLMVGFQYDCNKYLDLKYKKIKEWQQHNDLLILQHHCQKAQINGRDGVIVAGGSSDVHPALSSVEFFDLDQEKWLNLGKLREPRRFPSILVMANHLLVAGL